MENMVCRPQAHMEALRKLYTMASTDVPVEERQMAVGDNNLRPHLIHLNRCRNVLLDGFKIREKSLLDYTPLYVQGWHCPWS